MTECPRCGSPDPKRHPAIQFEGEVSICPDAFHAVKPDKRSEETKRWADGYCAQCGKAPHEAEGCNACRVQPDKQA